MCNHSIVNLFIVLFYFILLQAHKYKRNLRKKSAVLKKCFKKFVRDKNSDKNYYDKYLKKIELL